MAWSVKDANSGHRLVGFSGLKAAVIEYWAFMVFLVRHLILTEESVGHLCGRRCVYGEEEFVFGVHTP